MSDRGNARRPKPLREVGQGEVLTTRLRGLIRSYPKGPGILKEFVQNADDAGSRHVHFILDRRTHELDSLYDPVENDWLGPSLLVCNDATFTDADFEAIQRLGDSNKFGESLKTGKFGVGFNASYNVTDYPSFLSRDRVLFFDPHCRHDMAKSGRPGGGWEMDGLPWSGFHLIKLFEPGGVIGNTTTHNGTVFRLPLRTAEQAHQSEVCKEAFTFEQFDEIVAAAAFEADQWLLFVKNLTSITISEINTDGVARDILTCQTLNSSDVESARRMICDVVRPNCRVVLEGLRNGSIEPVNQCYEHSIESVFKGQPRQTNWLINNGLFVDDRHEVLDAADALLDNEGKALPWAGAAVQLDPDGRGVVKTRGRIFCFLPLPHASGLPVHVHGYFDLDSSRDHITDDETIHGKDALRVNWNRALSKHSVSQAYAGLIKALAARNTIPEGYYEAWPILIYASPLLSTIAEVVYRTVSTLSVIATSNGWVRPNTVYLPPYDRPELRDPIVAMGLAVPSSPLPTHVTEGLNFVGAGLIAVSPKLIRKQLKVKDHLATSIEEAADPWLRRRDWVIALLDYCISDNPGKDLNDVPLALMDDGKIYVFGSNLCILADSEVRDIFPNYKHWFIDADCANEVCLLPIPEARVVKMDLGLIVANIGKILDPQGEGKDLPWDAKSKSVPNERWLTGLLHYINNCGINLDEVSRNIMACLPWIPDQNGNLCVAGKDCTPLLPHQELRDQKSLMSSLRKIGVPIIQGPSDLLREFEEFAGSSSNDSLIWWLTGSDLVDTLLSLFENGEELPEAVKKQNIIDIIDFLSDARWINNYDRATLERFALLPIFPTTDSTYVAADGDNVFLPSNFKPPSVDTKQKLLLNPSSKWTTFYGSLGVKKLDTVTFLTDVLLPAYESLPPQDQFLGLQWLQENWVRIQREDETRSPSETDGISVQVRATALIRCNDGELRPAASVYDPMSTLVKDVLGDDVPYPDTETYGIGSDQWHQFFLDLGLATMPRPEDLLAYIDRLSQSPEALSGCLGEVRERMLVVYQHFKDHWPSYELEIVLENGNAVMLSQALAERCWLPAQVDSRSIGQYFGAEPPEDRLYKPCELYPPRLAQVVAGQAPIASFIDPPKSMRNELKFPSQIPTAVLLARLDHVVGEAQRLGKDMSNNDEKKLIKSLKELYRHVGQSYIDASEADEETDIESDDDTEVQNKSASETDLADLRSRYENQPCIWLNREKRFLPPTHVFSADVTYLFPFRHRVVIPKVDSGLIALGRREEPDANVLIDVLHEIQESLHNDPATDEVCRQVIQIYRRLEELLQRDGSNIIDGVEVPLLTDQKYLVSHSVVFEKNTTRFDGRFAGCGIHFLHSHVDSRFARRLNVPFLSAAVHENLKSEPVRCGVGALHEDAVRLQTMIRSDHFKVGLQRVIQAERDRGYIATVNWLDGVVIIAAKNITISLTLTLNNGKKIQDHGNTKTFVKSNEFFIANLSPGEVSYHLARAINDRLDQESVKEIDRISLMLMGPVEGIPERLHNAGVPDLVVFDTSTGQGDANLVSDDVWNDEEEAVTSDGVESDNNETVEEDEENHQLASQSSADQNQEDDASSPDDWDEVEDESSDEDSPVSDPSHDASSDNTPGTSSDSKAASKPSSGSTPSGGIGKQQKARRRSDKRSRGKSDETGEKGGNSNPAGKGSGQQYNTIHGQEVKPPGRLLPGDGINQHASHGQKKGRATSYAVFGDGPPDEQDPFDDEQPKNLAIGKAALEAVLNDELLTGWNLSSMSHNNPGYDVEAISPDGEEVRFIEVKGTRGAWGTEGVALSKTQLEFANDQRGSFWLFIVEYAEDPERRKIHRIRDPYADITQFRFDVGWSSFAYNDSWTSEQGGTKRVEPVPQVGYRVEHPTSGEGVVANVYHTKFGVLVDIELKSGGVKRVSWEQVKPARG